MSHRTQSPVETRPNLASTVRVRPASHARRTPWLRAGRPATTIALVAAAAFGARVPAAHAQTAHAQQANAGADVAVLAHAPAAAVANARVGPMPIGWTAVTSGRDEYMVGSDPSRRDGGSGQHGVTLRARTAAPLGYTALEQSIRADLYQGQRVRLSGFVRTAAGADIPDAGLWMRVDGPATSTSDYSGSPEHHPSRDDTDWARVEVVLDVPRDAVGISFGALLNGDGQLWVDDLALERVDRNVPLTGTGNALAPAGADAHRDDAPRRRAMLRAYEHVPTRPTNLGFTDGVREP